MTKRSENRLTFECFTYAEDYVAGGFNVNSNVQKISIFWQLCFLLFLLFVYMFVCFRSSSINIMHLIGRSKQWTTWVTVKGCWLVDLLRSKIILTCDLGFVTVNQCGWLYVCVTFHKQSKHFYQQTISFDEHKIFSRTD